MASLWCARFGAGISGEMRGGGPMILRAGRSAAPYLMRRKEWDVVATLMEQVAKRDNSPETLGAVLPLMRRIAEVTKGGDKGLAAAGVLAKMLDDLGQAEEAERTIKQVLNEAEDRGKFGIASSAAGHLANLLLAAGRPADTLAMLSKKKELTRMAGFGQWTQLSDYGRYLQVLNDLGKYTEALESVARLRTQMQGIHESEEAKEAVDPWDVREFILGIGLHAALGLERWEEALALNSEIAKAKEARGATALEIARTRFNDHASLLRLGRRDEARELLLECRERYEEASYAEGLGQVLTAIADLEYRLGNLIESIRQERNALRYVYHAGDPGSCALGHFNLATYIRRRGGDTQGFLAHRLASAVIWFRTSDGRSTKALKALSEDLAAFSPGPPPVPNSLDVLCEIVERVEGVLFRELFLRLPADNACTGDEAVQKVLDLARSHGTAEGG